MAWKQSCTTLGDALRLISYCRGSGVCHLCHARRGGGGGGGIGFCGLMRVQGAVAIVKEIVRKKWMHRNLNTITIASAA